VTQKGVEIQVKRLFIESLGRNIYYCFFDCLLNTHSLISATVLPLLVEDAARPQALLDQQAKEIEAIEKYRLDLTKYRIPIPDTYIKGSSPQRLILRRFKS